MSALERILNPIRRKIHMLIGRSILAYVDNSAKTQKLQLKLLHNEIATDLERFEEYGLTTYPFTDSEALGLFLSGNREHGVVICVHDKRYRPLYLQEGEIVLYTDEDQDSPNHRIHFKRSREIEMKCETMDQDVNGDNTVDVGGNRSETIGGNKSENISGSKLETIGGSKTNSISGSKTETSASSTETTGAKQITGTTCFIVAPSIALNGMTVIGGAAGAGKAIATEDIISVFNNHTHNENGDGGGVTDPPNSSLGSSQMSTNSKAV